MIKSMFVFFLGAIVFFLAGLFINPAWVAVTGAQPLPWFLVLLIQGLAAGATIKKGL